MKKSVWCEHLDLSSKYTMVKYYVADREVLLRVQTWICAECGVHGSDSELVSPACQERSTAS